MQMDEASPTSRTRRCGGSPGPSREPGGLLESAGGHRQPVYREGAGGDHPGAAGEAQPSGSGPRPSTTTRNTACGARDELSASASEIVAEPSRTPTPARLIGVKTYWQGARADGRSEPGDAAVRITTAKYLTPSGIDIHKKGIEPEIEVKMPEDIPDDATWKRTA